MLSRRALGAGGAALAVVAIAAVPLLGNPSRSDRFVTSSAAPGFNKEGLLGDQGPYGVMFHTRLEQDPWVLIDLGTARPLRSVRVRQRADCCQDRGIPLIAEVGLEKDALTEVARKDAAFDVWDFQLEGAPSVRFLRLRSVGLTILHLSEIQLR